MAKARTTGGDLVRIAMDAAFQLDTCHDGEQEFVAELRHLRMNLRIAVAQVDRDIGV
jgi:hypothetical protein